MYEPNSMLRSGASIYARVGLETGIMSATPHKMMAMLFGGVKISITMARHHMLCGEIAAKGNAISKAINIIDNGLKNSFDTSAGGAEGAALVANLLALYDYIVKRLMLANLRNNPDLLDEAQALLDNISSAWQEIDPQRAHALPEAANAPVVARFSTGA